MYVPVGGHLQFSLPARKRDRKRGKERKESSPGSKCVSVTLSRNQGAEGILQIQRDSSTIPLSSLFYHPRLISSPSFSPAFPSSRTFISFSPPPSFSLSAICFSPFSFYFGTHSLIHTHTHTHTHTPLQILKMFFVLLHFQRRCTI